MDIDKFDRILRLLSILTYKKDKVEFEKGELLAFIDAAKKLATDIDAPSSSILQDLTHAVPLMVEDGNYIRWTHKSIQEYFAAQYICRDTAGRQKEILSKYLHGPDLGKHINLITLCADIDKTSFKQSIGKELAEALLKEYESMYLGEYTGVPPNLLTNRRLLTAGRKLAITRMDLPDDFDPTNIGVKEYEAYFLPLNDELSKNLATSKYGLQVTWSPIGLGEVFTSLSEKIKQLRPTITLPFIDRTDPFTISELPDLGNYDDLLPKDDVSVINDDPANPLNSSDNFGRVNHVIEFYSGWKFNAEKAREFLQQIETESKAQEELMDTLSV